LGASQILSCQKSLKTLIPTEKMISITKELMLVETAIELRYGQIQKFQKISSASGKSILAKYGIDKNQYFNSLKYYSSNKEEINFIYSNIIDSLNVELNTMR
jgi:hypothetical protein